MEGVVDSIWFNQGEVCCAGSRILVAESVAPRFEALLRRRMKTLIVDDPLEKSADIGAIVHPVQRERIERLEEELLTGGHPAAVGQECPGERVDTGVLHGDGRAC